MRRWLPVLLVLAVTLSTQTAYAHGNHGRLKWGSDRWKTCRLPYQHDKEVKKLIACGVDHFPVPGGLSKALYIADRESDFEHWVHNGTCCGGVYQHHLKYWSGRVAAHNKAVGPRMQVKDNWRNGRSNVLVAIRMAHRKGWSPWGF